LGAAVNPPNISAFKTAAVAVLASVIWLTAPVTSAAAYEFDVHFTITIWLAEMVGFASDDAYEIAKYDQATDDDPATGPLTGGYLDRASVKRRRLYHFPNADRMAELRRAAERCPRGGRLSARDFKAVGWYLHAFEDVYAHKSHGPWLGHLVTWAHAGSTVDETRRLPCNVRGEVSGASGAAPAVREGSETGGGTEFRL
jgi:hypothetical protein